MTAYVPRFYQQESHDLAIEYMKKNSEPCLIVLPMGSGKALTVTIIANSLHEMSNGKIVLNLAPSKELTEQNYEKFVAMGGKASIYSASISKSLRNPIIFATAMSIIKVIKDIAHKVCGVIIDEAHGTTNTIKQIIEIIREVNPHVRVCGLTATPYNMGSGYCYEIDQHGKLVQETREPYYKKLVYSITANELISLGYLTPPQIGKPESHYDTSKLELKGKTFSDKDLNETFVGKEITQKIVADILNKTEDKNSVLVFASSIAHMEELVKLFPQEQTRILSGKTKKKEREAIVSDFKSFKFKYLINVGILTTGFDHSALDAIAILRATESAGLYQQILGRGTRLYEGKDTFLVLDYTDNIENFFGESGDVFEPNIKTYGSKPTTKIEVCCPECNTTQEFAHRKDFELYDKQGYAIDQFGSRLVGDIPAHYGRRCTGMTMLGKNKYKRCDYYWTHKECKVCGHKNDIASRKCEKCSTVLITPDDKLSETATVINVGDKNIATVNGMRVKENENIRIITFDTTHGDIIMKLYPNSDNKFIAQHSVIFDRATNMGEKIPKRIEYVKQKNGLFTVKRYIHV